MYNYSLYSIVCLVMYVDTNDNNRAILEELPLSFVSYYAMKYSLKQQSISHIFKLGIYA